MGLAADRSTPIVASGGARMNKGDLAAGAKVYAGGLIAKNAAGYIVPAADTAGLVVVGIAQEQIDNTGGANGALSVHYLTGCVVQLVNGGGAVVQANKHGACYATDDQTVTNSGGSVNKIVAGVVYSFTATTVNVFVDDALEQDTETPVDGSAVSVVTDAAVQPASTEFGVLGVIAIPIPDHATQTLLYTTTEKIEIVDVVVRKSGAGAANTIQIQTAGGAANVSDAIAAAVDKAITRAGTLDPAHTVFAAGAEIDILATRAAGVMTAEVFLYVIKRA